MAQEVFKHCFPDKKIFLDTQHLLKNFKKTRRLMPKLIITDRLVKSLKLNMIVILH